MMNKFLIVSLLIGLPISEGGLQVPTSVHAPTGERVICRDDPETGSLISKRICHTKAQWQEIEKAPQRGLEVWRDRPMQGFCPQNNPGCGG
jgi:hypothetical protein